jgi:hypothetical protein
MDGWKVLILCHRPIKISFSLTGPDSNVFFFFFLNKIKEKEKFDPEHFRIASPVDSVVEISRTECGKLNIRRSGGSNRVRAFSPSLPRGGWVGVGGTRAHTHTHTVSIFLSCEQKMMMMSFVWVVATQRVTTFLHSTCPGN